MNSFHITNFHLYFTQTFKDILQTMPFQPAPRVTIAGERKIILFQFQDLSLDFAPAPSIFAYIYSIRKCTDSNLLYNDSTDETNDRRSVDRKLPRSLFLIAKRNREDFAWQFPQGRIRDSEDSMRKVKNTFLSYAMLFHFRIHCIVFMFISYLLLSYFPLL